MKKLIRPVNELTEKQITALRKQAINAAENHLVTLKTFYNNFCFDCEHRNIERDVLNRLTDQNIKICKLSQCAKIELRQMTKEQIVK